jgi:lysophospholipase L1-like esterase
MSLTTLLLILVGVGVALLLAARQRRAVRLRAVAGGLLISYITVLLLLLAGEAYFRFAYAAPEGRLASNNWMARYWQTNALGYRDRAWTPADWQDKTTVALLGDSFTAGWGIEDTADRFGDVLAGLMGDDYAVFNLGVPGTSTPEQLARLRAFPVENPDVIILQYFLNDIQYAALRLGYTPVTPDTPPLAQESHLADFFYSRFNAGFGGSYWARMYADYDNFVIWDTHAAELREVVDYAESSGARLIVVLFPNMQDPVGSIPYVDRVAQVFEAEGVRDVLKLFDAVAAWQPREVVVSPLDAHPSAAFHRYVGEELYRLFFSE